MATAKCVACSNPEIDAATRDTQRSNRAIARDFGTISEAAVRRHRANHVTTSQRRERHAGAGRPSKFTEDRITRFLGAIRAGATFHAAALSVGWSDDALALYRRSSSDFSEQVAEAEGIAELSLVALVRDAARTNWRAALELLGRRFPETWGVRSRVDVDLRVQVKRLATEFGLDEREILEEAERLVAGH